jgi:hypothetical protein
VRGAAVRLSGTSGKGDAGDLGRAGVPVHGAVRKFRGGGDCGQPITDASRRAAEAALGQRAAADRSSCGAWAGAAFNRGAPAGRDGSEEFPPRPAIRVADDRPAAVPGLEVL